MRPGPFWVSVCPTLVADECAVMAWGSQEKEAEGNIKAYGKLCCDIFISLLFFLPEILKLFLSLKV